MLTQIDPVSHVLATFRSLPVATPNLGRFAVLAPHPDDESLGCGGLIAAACLAGAAPLVLILTDGAASHPGSLAYPPAAVAALRRQEAAAAVAALGLPASHLHFLNLPDGAASSAAAAAASRVAALAAGCDTILVTWRHDPHGDHHAAWCIAAAAARRLGAAVWEYPVWGWVLPPAHMLPHTAWSGMRIDVSAHLPAKRRAIAAHASQHGHVITDAPDGFVLPADFLSRFNGPYETLVHAA